jgi:hypothetical protein
MTEKVARAKAQQLSSKHKDIIIAVVITAFAQYTARNKYEIATEEELTRWSRPYVPVAEYKNGVEWQKN